MRRFVQVEWEGWRIRLGVTYSESAGETREPRHCRYSVPGAGIEPAWDFSRGILSPLRLPFRHPGGTPYHKGSVLFCNRGWIPTVRI